MLKSFLKLAARRFLRQKGYSFINVSGLAIGLVCSFFILLWVRDELAVDRFHEEGDRIMRVMRNAYFMDGQVFTWSAVPKPLEQVLATEYPEITQTVLMSWDQEMLVSTGEKTLREGAFYAGPAFFEVFSFPLVEGDAATVLDQPDGVAISEDLAARYFGEDWRSEGVVGKTLRIDDRREFTVRGVFERVPHASSLEFDLVMPIQDFIARNDWVEHWGNSGLRLYVKLREGADPAVVSGKIKDVINERRENASTALFLQPFEEMHLYSNFENGEQSGGRIIFVRIFTAVAIFILLIACINFMNLSTARSARRAREIGVRKAVGASRRSLVGQFLGEAVLMALLAFVLALGLVAAGLPGFNALTGKELSFLDLGLENLLLFFGIAALTGLLSGSYPALYLASFDVMSVLRSQVAQRAGGVRLRKGLVVFQFALSILLIICTISVYRQIDYVQTKELGLERENVISLVKEGGVDEGFESFRQELLQKPGIASVTASNQNPLSVGSSTTDPEWDGKDPEHQILFHIINADHDFVETMRMRLVAGRTHDRSFATDSMNYVINERAAEAMGMDDPVGQRLEFWGREGTIIGVVRDFHMTSLYSAIEPTIIRLSPGETGIVYVRTEPGQATGALASLKETFAKFNPGFPFEYQFMDDSFDEMYEAEQVIGTLANVFAVLAMFIACLGLFGLASFTTEQRTKEIGVRKVMGATVSGLVVLLSRDFIKLVAIAFLLAAPTAYFLTDAYLDHFAYRVDVGVPVFLAAGAAVLVVAWLTVSFQSVKAAVVNPVKALRYE